MASRMKRDPWASRPPGTVKKPQRRSSSIAVVALMASGITKSSLKFHLTNVKAHGVTRSGIEAIITHVAFYAGRPKGWAVFNLAKEVWPEND